MSTDDTKYKFLGIIKDAVANGTKLDLEIVSAVLDTPVPKLQRWFKDFEEQAKVDSALSLVNLDDVLLTRVLDKVAEEAEQLDQLRVNPITGVIEIVKPETATPAKLQIQHFRDSVTGLKLLNQELQATAGQITLQILEAAQETTSPRDLSSLANALTNIQNAFFNKPTTNVQVNNINAQVSEGQTSLLDAFKRELKH